MQEKESEGACDGQGHEQSSRAEVVVSLQTLRFS